MYPTISISQTGEQSGYTTSLFLARVNNALHGCPQFSCQRPSNRQWLPNPYLQTIQGHLPTSSDTIIV